MKEYIEILLETVSKIQNPLHLWAFALVITLLILYLIVKSKYNINLPSDVISKLTSKDLFKIQKLILLIIAATLILFILSLFIFPLLLSNKKVEEDFNKVDKYQKIVVLYEGGYHNYSKVLIRETYGVANLSNDQYKGYIVASYYGQGDFKKAAIEVLERDKMKKKWDFSLLPDLSLCIRGYTLKYGRVKGLRLIEELQKIYGKKLCSVFWTVIPYEFVRNSVETKIYLFEGDRLIDFTQSLSELIDIYPDDPYIDFAYLAIGDYDKVVQNYPGSLCYDIAIFGKAFSLLKIIRGNHRDDLKEHCDFLNNNSFQKERELINEAIKLFTKYVEKYPTLDQCDDAHYWLGWLYSQGLDYNSGFQHLLRAQFTGNKDFSAEANILQWKIIERVPKDLKKKYLEYLLDNTKKMEQVTLVRHIIQDMDPEIAIEMVFSVNNLNDTVIKAIIDNQIHNYGNLDNCIRIYKRFHKVIVHNDLKKIYEISEELPINTDLVNQILKLKSISSCRILTYQLIERVKKRNTIYNINAVLSYLQIDIAELEFPERTLSLVDDFLRRYPVHEFADDACAIQVYVNSQVIIDFNKAESYNNIITQRYCKSNSRDNSLYWLALGYAKCGFEEKAIAKYKEIIKRFPYTRFARYSISDLARINSLKEVRYL